MRVEFVNASDAADDPLLPARLHPGARAARPTSATCTSRSAARTPPTLRRDFVIADGLRGPGRFLGCNVGVRVIDPADWYGEGEVKVYRDGDTDLPTICGTGLEDYVGSAWGLGALPLGPTRGAPLVVTRPGAGGGPLAGNPDFVGFYRWHLPDPIMFSDDLRVTIQQIGAKFFAAGQEAELAAYERRTRSPVDGLAPRPRARDAGVGHRRTGRRLLRHRVRVLHRGRSRCRVSTSRPRPPTSPGATTSPPIRSSSSARMAANGVATERSAGDAARPRRGRARGGCAASAMVRNISSPRSVRSTSIDAAMAMISPAQVPRR